MTALFERLLTRLAHVGCRCGEALIRVTDRRADKVYFDAGEFAWARELEAHWADIRAELDALLAGGGRIPTFQEVSREQLAISDDDRWRTYFLHVFGRRVDVNCARCPRTAALLADIPGLGNAVFSILLPGKHIPPHRGPYKGVLRYHLALRVPEPAHACWIDVAGERRHWTEGCSLLFDDSFTHSAANDTQGIRVVLFLDVPRPLPRAIALLNRVVIALMSATSFARRPYAFLAEGRAPAGGGALD